MSGTLPEFKDLLNSIARGLLIWYVTSFKTLGAIQSGPRALFTLILPSPLVTVSSVESQSLKGIKLVWTGFHRCLQR